MATATIYEKSCSKCKQMKPVTDFHKHSILSDGLRSECKSCRREYASHPDARAKQRAYRIKNRDRKNALYAAVKDTPQRKLATRKTKLKTKYNLSLSEYDNLLKRQNGRCAICSVSSNGSVLVVDHCHKTRKVRGLLCAKCNTALGMFGDNLEGVLRVVCYLQAL